MNFSFPRDLNSPTALSFSFSTCPTPFSGKCRTSLNSLPSCPLCCQLPLCCPGVNSGEKRNKRYLDSAEKKYKIRSYKLKLKFCKQVMLTDMILIKASSSGKLSKLECRSWLIGNTFTGRAYKRSSSFKDFKGLKIC